MNAPQFFMADVLRVDNLMAATFVVAQFVLFLASCLLLRARRSHDKFIPSAFKPTYEPGRLIRFLVRCSGVHPNDLEPLGAGAHLRHAICGAMMFVPATMAFLGVSMWMGTFQEAGPLSRNVAGVVGGTLVFLIDLGVMTSLSGATGRRAAFSVATRVTFALVLGYFVAKPFVVAVYKDEIARLQREKKQAEVLKVAGRAQDEREKFAAAEHRPLMENFRTAKAELARRMEALAPRRQTLQQRHIELNKQYVEEVTHGQNGRPDGEGSYAKFIKAEMEKVAADLGALKSEETALANELARLANEEEETIAKVVSDPKFNETNAAFDQLMREAKDSEAASLERQDDLVRQYVMAGGIGRWVGYVLWHLLFILADTVPVLTKLTMLRRDFLTLADLREKRLEADIQAECENYKQFSKEKARARHESELQLLKLRGLIENLDVWYAGTVHVMLRSLQVEAEVRKAYLRLRPRKEDHDHHDDPDWPSFVAPLHQLQERILDSLGGIINGASNDVSKNGNSKNGTDDSASPMTSRKKSNL